MVDGQTGQSGALVLLAAGGVIGLVLGNPFCCQNIEHDSQLLFC